MLFPPDSGILLYSISLNSADRFAKHRDEDDKWELLLSPAWARCVFVSVRMKSSAGKTVQYHGFMSKVNSEIIKSTLWNYFSRANVVTLWLMSCYPRDQ